MKKKLLLTGASGFVGSYFQNHYKDTYDIKTFSFLNEDFDKLELKNIYAIVHLSALVHQMGGASKEEYERVNVTQSLKLAQKAKQHGVKHFIFMSSVKVYGEETTGVYSETSECLAEDEYGKSKLKAEDELLKLEEENFLISIVRTPIVYGFGVKANIANLIKIVSKMYVLPFGDIYNKRSMVYVGNLSYLLSRIIDKKLNGVFLASDEKTLSTKEFIQLIAKTLHKKIYLIQVPLFARTLRIIKPSFYKRLYQSLEIQNKVTIQKLFDEDNLPLPYSVEDGIKYMIKGGDE